MREISNRPAATGNPFYAQPHADEADQGAGQQHAQQDTFAGPSRGGFAGANGRVGGTRGAATRHSSTAGEAPRRPANNVQFGVNARQGTAQYDGPTSGFRDVMLTTVAVVAVTSFATASATASHASHLPSVPNNNIGGGNGTGTSGRVTICEVTEPTEN